MATTTAGNTAASAARGAPAAWLPPWLRLTLLLLAWPCSAWWVGRAGWFRPGDDFGYWIAVTGGTLMLLLMLYPARKHLRVMRNLGPAKSWLRMHLLFGLLGPWLIVVHSTLRLGSLNASVAMGCMLMVVASGVVGRWLYGRVNRGLDGEITSLRELQTRAGLVENDARSRLAFAPEVAAALLACEQRVHAVPRTALGALRLVVWLPLQLWRERRRCQQALEAPLRNVAREHGWNDADLARRRRHARTLVVRYLDAVQRVAQFGAVARVFAMWHIGHLPFVVLMFASAIVHVVAVHAY